MLREIFHKWFGIPLCPSCDILREQLEISNHERRKLMDLLINRSEPVKEQESVNVKELEPVGPKHIPWRVRQQLLEAEDRAKAILAKQKAEEISKLESELGVDENAG